MESSYIDLFVIETTQQYVVWESARVKDQHVFAKKQLKPEAEGIGADRFRNEARLLARLNHPNIIRVVDQQLNEFPLYVITPRYATDLRKWLGTKPDCDFDKSDLHDIFERLLDAVAYAHEEGVIHRDLKPENVLLNSPRDVVLIDFNISLSPQDGPDCRLTRPGQMLGTLLYLAPEQLKDSASIDERADIYSLGIILYEMYGGRVGSSTLALEDLPAPIRGIVQRCTYADRGRRYSSVSELKRAWHLALDLNTKQSEINELEMFMLQGSSCNSAQAERVLELLVEYSSDEDRIDRFFMEADASAVTLIAQTNLSELEGLISNWVSFFSEKSWPFSYTDDIARRAELLWTLIDSPATRAQLAIALIRLGNSHNRFFVWRVAGGLIEKTSNKLDIDALVQQLIVLDRDDLSSVSEYLVRPRLNPVVAQIFVNERASSE